MSTNFSFKNISNWEDYDLKNDLLRGIYSYGFEEPSPIQKKGIQPVLENHDLIAQAQSGTGKTGCFSIGALNIVDQNIELPQILILSPTRELSYQIKSVLDNLSKYMKNINIQLLIGGVSRDLDIENIKINNPQILVGCPGRIYDIFNRKLISVSNIKYVIMDEADELLSSGFKEQIYNIFNFLPNNIQISLFSATIPKDLYYIIDNIMNNPVNISVKSDMLTLDGIKQYYVNLNSDNDKYLTLKDLFSTFSVAQCIIYCNTVKKVKELYELMIIDNYPVCQIHSSLDKNDRLKNYNDFKQGKVRVLISSNITARGIDIQQVSTVINYDIPKNKEIYIHRIGRSGRWGRKGIAINFITKKDILLLKNIEDYYSTQINELPINYIN